MMQFLKGIPLIVPWLNSIVQNPFEIDPVNLPLVADVVAPHPSPSRSVFSIFVAGTPHARLSLSPVRCHYARDYSRQMPVNRPDDGLVGLPNRGRDRGRGKFSPAPR